MPKRPARSSSPLPSRTRPPDGSPPPSTRAIGALAVAPSDTDLHLALVDLYMTRGWRAPAAEKLLLLSRLIDLDGDGPARERLCSMIAARFPDDPRLAAICA